MMKRALLAPEVKWMKKAITLSQRNIEKGIGGPFAALVVKDGTLIATGTNGVTSKNDPTAHAEVTAIRNACKKLHTFQLTGCDIYTSCEPCPMCLGAIYWARPDRVFFANTRQDAAEIDFDDLFIYQELVRPISHRKIPMLQVGREEALKVFEQWKTKKEKIKY